MSPIWWPLVGVATVDTGGASSRLATMVLKVARANRSSREGDEEEARQEVGYSHNGRTEMYDEVLTLAIEKTRIVLRNETQRYLNRKV